MRYTTRLITPLAAAILALTACANQPEMQPAAEATATMPNSDDYYQVEHDGRLYIFDDRAVFKNFVTHWETPYRKVRIGAGPDGQTLVFGLTDADKKKTDGIASIDLYEGRIEGGENFYAEVWSEGRVYVFSAWDDLQGFRSTGEANLRFTDIGAGPDGRTVIYVLNDGNKKQKPVALMATFKSVHSL